jgi:hypothetical protein
MTAGDALKLTFRGPILRRSLIVALVVGTILNAINQGPEFLAVRPIILWKLAMTFCVPLCVASYGAYAALRNS